MSERRARSLAGWCVRLRLSFALLLCACQIESASLTESALERHPRTDAPSETPYRLSAWQASPDLASASSAQPALTTLTPLKPALRADAPSLPISRHLCLGLSPKGPPTIAWRGGLSPPLIIPAAPEQSAGVLLLMLDWDTPSQAHWRLLNETYLPRSMADESIKRAPHILWAAFIPHQALNTLRRAQSRAGAPEGYLLPAGYGGEGHPLQERALPLGAYQALNSYSDWFSHPPLKSPSAGYAGPCVPRRDPRAHIISALVFTLKSAPKLPPDGSSRLLASELWARSASEVTAVSRFDWRARLPHTPPRDDPDAH